jgi:hypothetical protein
MLQRPLRILVDQPARRHQMLPDNLGKPLRQPPQLLPRRRIQRGKFDVRRKLRPIVANLELSSPRRLAPTWPLTCSAPVTRPATSIPPATGVTSIPPAAEAGLPAATATPVPGPAPLPARRRPIPESAATPVAKPAATLVTRVPPAAVPTGPPVTSPSAALAGVPAIPETGTAVARLVSALSVVAAALEAALLAT